jgi:hypothetical protein
MGICQEAHWFQCLGLPPSRKICFALLKVNPYLKECEDYITAKIRTQAPAAAPVTPANKSRNVADFFSSIKSAKSRVQSFTRTKASLAIIIKKPVQHSLS